jgi:hypothetical protein
MLEDLRINLRFERKLSNEERARIEAQAGILFGIGRAYAEMKEFNCNKNSEEYELLLSLKQAS